MTAQPRTLILEAVSKTCCKLDYSVRSRERTILIIQDIRKKKAEILFVSTPIFGGRIGDIDSGTGAGSPALTTRTNLLVRTTAPQLVSAPLPPVIFGEVMEMSECQWAPPHNRGHKGSPVVHHKTWTRHPTLSRTLTFNASSGYP
jgi:hypothetical protein